MIFSKNFRTDIEDYFQLSGVRECKKLSHHPFVVFTGDFIEIVYSAVELVNNFSDDVEVIAQWGGNYKSDFFKFTVGDFKRHIAKNPKENYHVI